MQPRFASLTISLPPAWDARHWVLFLLLSHPKFFPWLHITPYTLWICSTVGMIEVWTAIEVSVVYSCKKRTKMSIRQTLWPQDRKIRYWYQILVKLLSPSTHTRHHPFCLYVHLCVCVYVQLPMSKEVCRTAENSILPQDAKDLQRDGLMGWVTSSRAIQVKTIPEITTLDEGPRDFDHMDVPSWDNKQHLKKYWP